MRVWAASEFAEIMGDNEVILTPSEKADELLIPLVPSWADMHAEVRSAIRGVEFVPMKRNWHSVWLCVDPDTRWSRKKVYARINLDHEDIVAGNVELVRGACLHACRLIGQKIAEQIDVERTAMKPPPGASVTYATAFADRRSSPMTVRSYGQTVPVWCRRRGDDEKSIGALIDQNHDRYVLRLAAYFVVAPVGEEMEFEAVTK